MSNEIKKRQEMPVSLPVGRVFSPIVSRSENTNNVIDMAKAAAQLRHRSAPQSQSIISRGYEAIQDAAIRDRAVAIVTRQIHSLFPSLREAVRSQMVEDISGQLIENPRTRSLLSA